jgi:5-methylcytosine-specific restriction protein B
LRRILSEVNISTNDPRVVFSVRDGRLNFTVGQRYCFNIYTSNDKGIYGVVSKSKLLEDSTPYEGPFPQPYYSYYQSFNPNSQEWESIIESIKGELSRTSKSGYRKYNNVDFENYLYSSNQIIKNETMHSLNTILYGPPGTGKTFNTIIRAAEVILNRKTVSYEEALTVFKDNLHNRIEFITFHQNYSYEDFIQGLRPETDNKASLTFDKKDGIFKKIADRARQNKYFLPVGTELKDYTVIKSNEDIIELWSEKTMSIRYVPPRLIIDLYDAISSGKISLEDIKKRRDLDLPELINSKVEKYYFGIEGTLYNICEYLFQNEKTNNLLNYVIVIDEINRANISRVFGELITLIEPDKRLGGKTPLEVQLPSGDLFSVPSNLYIIGTMNTADKSIALLDIALRRRFEFESMYPIYEFEDSEIFDRDILLKINEQIIDSKGHDFQIGHAYFMGENNNLIERMNKKVIPLLLEYYMNDKNEVSKILYNAGLQVEEKTWPLKIIGRRA